MDKNKIQSYEEIISFLEIIDKERKIINSKLSVMGFSLFDEEVRTEKKRLKKRLKEIKYIFKYFNNLIKDYTTFDRKILLPFLAEYLSKNTDTKYVVCKGEDSVWTGKFYVYYYYDFIYPVSDILKFRYRRNNIDKPLDYDSLNQMASHRFISLDECSNYTLMNLNGLFKEFKEFPELEEVVERLINLKISCPYMSDEDRLLKVLYNVKSNRDKYKINLPFDKDNLNGQKELNGMTLSEIYNFKKR